MTSIETRGLNLAWVKRWKKDRKFLLEWLEDNEPAALTGLLHYADTGFALEKFSFECTPSFRDWEVGLVSAGQPLSMYGIAQCHKFVEQGIESKNFNVEIAARAFFRAILFNFPTYILTIYRSLGG